MGKRVAPWKLGRTVGQQVELQWEFIVSKIGNTKAASFEGSPEDLIEPDDYVRIKTVFIDGEAHLEIINEAGEPKSTEPVKLLTKPRKEPRVSLSPKRLLKIVRRRANGWSWDNIAIDMLIRKATLLESMKDYGIATNNAHPERGLRDASRQVLAFVRLHPGTTTSLMRRKLRCNTKWAAEKLLLLNRRGLVRADEWHPGCGRSGYGRPKSWHAAGPGWDERDTDG